MEVIKTIKELQAKLDECRSENKSIGFVPTMGALHRGHISLVERSVAENDATVASVFVNPTQFNNKEDLEKYPRTGEADLAMLKKAGTDIVFVPTVEEMYPEPDKRQFDFGKLATVMEGQFRPGHFNGVAQVVSRLFDIVKPDRAYFGEKDFQQLAIIRDMVKQLGLKVEIKGCPIVREPDGLAMSSRNMRLSDELRKEAAGISQVLFKSKEIYKEYAVSALILRVLDHINALDGINAEYFEIVDGFTLQPIHDWSETAYPVGCVAAFAGGVRLIDNIVYDNPLHPSFSH